MSNEGKKVKIHYVGTLDDGTQFDSSVDRGEPIEFVCMSGQVIPGFDNAVKDMEVGEKKKIRLEPKDAYGEVDESLVQSIPYEQFPNAEMLPVGEMIYLSAPDGSPIPVTVKSADPNGDVVLDMNPPMAGKTLNFDLELVSVED